MSNGHKTDQVSQPGRCACGAAWEISRGPGRTVGPAARSLIGVFAPLPDDFEFEFCPKCRVRNMTSDLERRLLAVETLYHAR